MAADGGSAVYQIFLLFFKYLFELCVENWQRLRKEFLFSNFSRETERSTEHVCRARARARAPSTRFTISPPSARRISNPRLFSPGSNVAGLFFSPLIDSFAAGLAGEAGEAVLFWVSF